MLLCLDASHWGCVSYPVHGEDSGHLATEEKRTRCKPNAKCYVLKLRKNQIKNNFRSRTQLRLTGFVQVISP